MTAEEGAAGTTKTERAAGPRFQGAVPRTYTGKEKESPRSQRNKLLGQVPKIKHLKFEDQFF